MLLVGLVYADRAIVGGERVRSDWNRNCISTIPRMDTVFHTILSTRLLREDQLAGTRSSAGALNLAPYSFFSANYKPPLIGLCLHWQEAHVEERGAGGRVCLESSHASACGSDVDDRSSRPGAGWRDRTRRAYAGRAGARPGGRAQIRRTITTSACLENYLE